MTRIKSDKTRRPRDPVTPSARDPITQWLEVFTSLLTVSHREQERIRDELEDHLRMRAEDLLILGMSEPQAIQQAVKELGETAELAQRFREATTHTSRTQRKTIMQSILIASAAMGLTLGTLHLTNAPAVPAPTGLALTGQDAADQAPDSIGLERDLAPGSVAAAFEEIASQNDAKLFVHWGSLENMGSASEDTELPAIPAAGLPISKALELINSALNNENKGLIDVRLADGLMEFATVEYFDAHESVTLDYDVSALVPAAHAMQVTTEGQNLESSLMSIIEPEVWEQGRGALSITGSHLSVRAPERVQSKIAAYLDRLSAAAARQEHELARLEEVELQERHAERIRAMEQLSRLRGDMTKQADFFKSQFEAASKRYWEAQYLADELEARYRGVQDDQEREELRHQLVEIKARLEAEELNSQMYKDRFRSFQARLEEVEARLAGDQL